MSYLMCSHHCWAEAKDHLPQPAGDALWYNQPLCNEGTHCWLVVSLLFTRNRQSFSAGCPLACSRAWCYSSPAAGLCIFCWTSWGFSVPISAASWSLSGWQHTYLVPQTLLPDLIIGLTVTLANSLGTCGAPMRTHELMSNFPNLIFPHLE